ncbi:PREDICTED: olfactory receptor 2AT4-like [Acanthisitta chloris]|uniref:olfactory receptor 2AT4-like n=1 Tax=Acanthisitta chloris TaxID=57068 RepID=UPI0004F0D731|nr:PREDICTED: olfactory receptor 2AT4-like [Acanthisitta chloris]
MTVSVASPALVTSSYVHIIPSILKIKLQNPFLYVLPIYIPTDVWVMSNVVFSILTPLLNPIICTFWSKEVKSAVKKSLCLKIFPLSKIFI